ncbi:MAG: S-methyl-5'-thioadenosine phosphorylase [Thermosulfidibacteraceae bacterium]|jgi:5'-methylthioadenosine phosphorylase
MTDVRIAVIGGSGLYEMENFKLIEEVEIETPFGKPSDRIVVGELKGKKIAFLPRHGKGHRILPSEINFRANIFALKKLGVERIISISAVGSMKEEIKPGDFVIVDQFIDMTKGRISTFFGGGIVAHVSMANPVCPELSDIVYKVAKDMNYRVHKGGTYICIEGPQFSSKAESNLYRSWSVDVIGMTNVQEAKLAREAEICYTTIAMTTDYDCWHEEHDAVTVEMVVKTLLENVAKVKKLIENIVESIPEERNCPCKDALKDAIITNIKAIPKERIEELKPIIGKYIK